MKNNNKGFSLVIAMLIVIIITLLAFTILEYVIPFSRDIKGIENSSKAYYQANSGIEEGLYNIYDRNYGGGDTRLEYSKSFAGVISSSYSTTSSGTILPPPGEGNSEYDKDMYIVYSGNPVQLFIGNGYYNTSNDFKLYLKLPDLNKDGTHDESIKGGTLPIINWQLSSTTNTLNSSGSMIKATDINSNNNNTSYIDMKVMQGVDLDGNETINQRFGKFYEDNCSGIGSGCTLKLSVINKLETDAGPNSIIIPYLEWKLDVGNNSIIPLRYTKLQTSGKAFGFKKDIDIKIPSQTVSEAFDFTVFQ